MSSPSGGGASVLLRKARSYAEVYNDLDQDAVNLFRVLRNRTQAELLSEQLRLTPFARLEFNAAYEISDDPVELARRLIIRSFMGHGGDAPNIRHRTGFRANANRNGTTPAHDWVNYPPALKLVIDRLSAVTIENKHAHLVMQQHDRHDTLHYADPPYLPETRAPAKRSGDGYIAYTHELKRKDHQALLACLLELVGMVVLSGYPSPLYDEALIGWRRIETEAHADGGRARTEVLWLNPACAVALDAQRCRPVQQAFSIEPHPPP